MWALLDHDISTVMFAPDGSRLLGIAEIVPQIKTLKDPSYKAERQRGWRVSGLAEDDAGGVYTTNRVAEYLSGYAGPPPMIHLRPGETLRRYLTPGLEDGKTFVFWGMNYNTDNIPGPERSRTWVNQPDRMWNATRDAGHHPGQARYANAVYTYTPRFTDDTWKQGAVYYDDDHVIFEFRCPYVIAATPPNASKWGIYDPGARNGLIVSARRRLSIQVSADSGKTWSDWATAEPGKPLDLTDHVKGHYQYFLRAGGNYEQLKDSGLSIRTVSQCNVAIIPRLRGGTNRITYRSCERALISYTPIGGEKYIVDGKLNSPSVTLELYTPRGEKPLHLYAASWQASGNPPDPNIKYQIDYSTDAGQTWKPIVKDWQITRRAPEPNDFWSQSFTWGDTSLPDLPRGETPIRVRYTNTGKKPYRKIEAHLAYQIANPTPTRVTFGWNDSSGPRTATHAYAPTHGAEDTNWKFDAGTNVQSRWVEYASP
jgi:hypothetical protein